MKAGDAIRHIPTGETWTVAAISPDGSELVCCGWPESIAKVTDCELVESCKPADHEQTLRAVISSCGDQLRGSWARFEQAAAVRGEVKE
jgi:hypothetical protein